jgi:hypothetical protein
MTRDVPQEEEKEKEEYEAKVNLKDNSQLTEAQVNALTLYQSSQPRTATVEQWQLRVPAVVLWSL